jgi:iron complex outermembrane receptor protein
MTELTRYILLAGVALFATTGIAPSANAQTTVSPSTAPTAQPSENTLEEVVVTAQRRSENLQSVPIAVTAVTADMLQARGASNMTDIIAAVPSLTMASGNYLQPRIRGIGNTAVGPGFESGVAVYVDGVYQASPAGNLFSLSNIDRIEVLKGPQGTLFGRNATGGVIQIVTSEPLEKFDGKASVTAANYDDYSGDLYVTDGLAPGVAANFAGHVESQGDGWGKNQYNNQDVYRVYHDVALRSSLLLQPTDRTRIRITGDYENNDSTTGVAQKLVPGTGFPFPGLARPTGNPWNVDSDVQPLAQLLGGGISANATQDLDFASLVSITAYRRSNLHLTFDGDVTNIPLLAIDIVQPDRQFSQELQLASGPGSPIKGVIGAFYFDASSGFDPSTGTLYGLAQPVTPLGPINSAVTYDRLGTRSLAGYAQATAPIFDATNLTLGLRYTHERKNITDISQATYIAGIPVPLATTLPNNSVTYNRPTWRVSLDHPFSPELMVYASYNRGFKSGGFNGQNPTDAAFLPEKLDAYEVGEKADLLGHHLRINAAAFYYDYTNIQVTRYVDSEQSFYNGAAAHVYGLDVDFEGRLTRGFTLSGGFTLLHDRFADFPNAIISIQVPTGIMITTGSAKGNRLPFTADFSGTLTATYHVPTQLGEASFDASYTYSDGYYAQPDNILRQPAYDLVSFGAGLTLNNGIDVRVWMRNALDTKIYSSLQAGTIDSNETLQAPRTYGITLGVKF